MLTPRLAEIARRVPHNARVADIGTDHARLPVFLAERGITAHVIATDVRAGPLQRGGRTVRAHRLTERISLREGDGGACLLPEEVDVAVVAGMGGDAIAAILRNSPWLADKLLFLQPMTRIPQVVDALAELQCPVREEVRVCEGKRVYTILIGGKHMTAVRDVVSVMEAHAPLHLAEDGDPVGLLAGRRDAPVRRIMVALDITQDVIREAADAGAQMLIAHHPVVYEGKRFTDGDAEGRRLLLLAEKGLAALCLHTNLDAVQGGVNALLCDALGLPVPRTVVQMKGTDPWGRPYGFGFCAELPEARDVVAFAAHAKTALDARSLRYYDADRPVKKLAVGSGACGDIFPEAVAMGCDTFLTGDIKHHLWLDARDMDVNLIDAGHFPTENVICGWIAAFLREQLPGVDVLVSARHEEPFCVL